MRRRKRINWEEEVDKLREGGGEGGKRRRGRKNWEEDEDDRGAGWKRRRCS